MYVCVSDISAAMYGTLSFGKGDKCSSAEFHAVSAVHSRRQRQPDCDACKTARVKCRISVDGDKCGRCRGRNRPYTYNATRRQSRHSDVSSDKAEPNALAAQRTIEAGTRGTVGRANIGDASPDTPLVAESVSSSPQQDSPPPLLQPTDGAQWWDGHHDCLFEPFDFMVDSERTDGGISRPQDRVAASHHELDVASPSSPEDPAAVCSKLPDNYDFSTCSHQLSLPQMSLFKLWQMPMGTMTWDGAGGEQHGNKRPAASSPASPFSGTQVEQQRQPNIDSVQDDRTLHRSTLTGFSDLTDGMQFANGEFLGSRTPISDPCTCLQNLTASLFSLRNCAEATKQVDGFLIIFRQAMRGWEAVEVCPSACCGQRSIALLLLMNVQELVALLLEVASTVDGSERDMSRNRDSVPAIKLGAFTVDNEADQGIIAHIILAARMKEIHSFVRRIRSKMVLAGLHDVCAELDIQIKTLRGAFVT